MVVLFASARCKFQPSRSARPIVSGSVTAVASTCAARTSVTQQACRRRHAPARNTHSERRSSACACLKQSPGPATARGPLAPNRRPPLGSSHRAHALHVSHGTAAAAPRRARLQDRPQQRGVARCAARAQRAAAARPRAQRVPHVCGRQPRRVHRVCDEQAQRVADC